MANKAELVEQIKSLQRSDQDMKQAWGAYCDQQLGGVRDPNRHDVGALQAFLSSYSSGPGATSYNGSGSRGTSYAAAPWNMQGQDEDQVALAQQVKDLQRSDPECKQAWAEYCDSSLGGTRDPNRHDAGTLQGFLDAYTAGHLAPARGKVSYAESVADAVAPWSRNGASSKGASASAYSNAPRSGGKGGSVGSYGGAANYASYGGAENYANYGSAVGGAGAGGGMSADFVGLVKTGQRISSSFKGCWQGYCNAYGNGTMDPAKHEQTYITGFFDYLGQLGLADLAAAPVAPSVGSKRSAPSSWSMPPAKRTMGVAPQGHAMDDEKTALVDRVKSLQRQNQDIKQAWSVFVDDYHNGTRDPARHSKETLETFLAKVDV